MSGFGGTVKLQGESQYRKALSEITSCMKVLNSEMKAVTSQFDRNDKSVENLSGQNEVLTKKITEQEKKVELLKNALEKSKEETGENNESTRKWQTQLNNAQAELNTLNRTLSNNKKTIKEAEDATEKAEKATNDNSNAVKKYGENAEKAGNQSLKLGDIIKANLISEAMINGFKGLVNLSKKLGSTMLDIGKSAVESYADYEQLTGGVETLFKKSSDKVQQYADNAYKTSGLSANQYMETVTGFSASLLQSLDGDTEKAAEKAETAIVDMADNANKMGTDIELIKNAYQGFAKGNYTMLDNLKLGYGGTATEMARLINDSGVLGDKMIDLGDKQNIGAALSEVGFAKMTEAIHKVQAEMGITGTTAKEANTTISGSLASVKSAWQNLLTGVANEDADFSGLVKNLVDSVLIAFNNLKPVIGNVITGLGSLVASLGEEIIKQLPFLLETGKTLLQTLLSALTKNIDPIFNAAFEVVSFLSKAILNNLPKILKMGIKMLTSLINGIAKQLPELIPMVVKVILKITKTLLNNIDLVVDAGINIIMGLVDGLLVALPDLIDELPVIIDKLVSALAENLPKIIEAGWTILIKLAVGIVKAVPKLLAKIPEIVKSLVDGFKNYWSNMGEVGKNLVQGIWQGISDATGWILEKIKGFGKDVLDGIKGFFGIHSPSTVFKDQVGKNLALGIGEGFSSTMSDVSRKMNEAVPTKFDAVVNAKTSSGAYNNNPLSNSVNRFNVNINFGNVTMNNDLDIRKVASKISDCFVNDIMAVGGAFS